MPRALATTFGTSIEEGLATLYRATGGAGWTSSNKWLDADACTYRGLECDDRGTIVVSLEPNGLNGTVPTQLGTLAAARELYLGVNDLSGVMPTELGNLQNLEFLSLRSNSLSGTVPTQLGRLSGTLRHARLHANSFSGAVPTELGRLEMLQTLYLARNEISGTVASQIGSLARLLVLVAHENALSGTLPPELVNLEALTTCGLQDNRFACPLPALPAVCDDSSVVCSAPPPPPAGPPPSPLPPGAPPPPPLHPPAAEADAGALAAAILVTLLLLLPPLLCLAWFRRDKWPCLSRTRTRIDLRRRATAASGEAKKDSLPPEVRLSRIATSSRLSAASPSVKPGGAGGARTAALSNGEPKKAKVISAGRGESNQYAGGGGEGPAAAVTETRGAQLAFLARALALAENDDEPDGLEAADLYAGDGGGVGEDMDDTYAGDGGAGDGRWAYPRAAATAESWSQEEHERLRAAAAAASAAAESVARQTAERESALTTARRGPSSVVWSPAPDEFDESSEPAGVALVGDLGRRGPSCAALCRARQSSGDSAPAAVHARSEPLDDSSALPVAQPSSSAARRPAPMSEAAALRELRI